VPSGINQDSPTVGTTLFNRSPHAGAAILTSLDLNLPFHLLASDLLSCMTPIHELLNRIRYDKEFGQGRFEIGYFDRREGTIHRVAIQHVEFPLGEGRAFELLDEFGQLRRIPFHRIREVYRDGLRIWQRPA